MTKQRAMEGPTEHLEVPEDATEFLANQNGLHARPISPVQELPAIFKRLALSNQDSEEEKEEAEEATAEATNKSQRHRSGTKPRISSTYTSLGTMASKKDNEKAFFRIGHGQGMTVSYGVQGVVNLRVVLPKETCTMEDPFMSEKHRTRLILDVNASFKVTIEKSLRTFKIPFSEVQFVTYDWNSLPWSMKHWKTVTCEETVDDVIPAEHRSRIIILVIVPKTVNLNNLGLPSYGIWEHNILRAEGGYPIPHSNLLANPMGRTSPTPSLPFPTNDPPTDKATYHVHPNPSRNTRKLTSKVPAIYDDNGDVIESPFGNTLEDYDMNPLPAPLARKKGAGHRLLIVKMEDGYKGMTSQIQVGAGDTLKAVAQAALSTFAKWDGKYVWFCNDEYVKDSMTLDEFPIRDNQLFRICRSNNVEPENYEIFFHTV